MQKFLILLACALGAIFLPITLGSSLAASGNLAPAQWQAAASSGTPPYVLTTIAVGRHPKGVAVNPDDNMIYTVLVDNSQIVKIYGGNNQTQLSEPTGGTHPNQVAYNTVFKRLYVTNRDSDTLTFVDPTSLGNFGAFTTGHLPFGVAVDGDAWAVYVVNFDSSSIMGLNAFNGTPIITIHVPVAARPSSDYPTLASFDSSSRRLYVPGWMTGNLYVVDANKKAYQFAGIGQGAFGVAVDSSTGRVYATNRTNGNVFEIECLQKLTLKCSTNLMLQLPTFGYALAVNPNTHHLFVVSETDVAEYVYVVDTVTHQVIQTLWVGGGDLAEGGQGIAVNLNTNRVYVSNYNYGILTVIQDGIAVPTATATPTLTPTNSPTPTPTFTPTPSMTPDGCVFVPQAPLLVLPANNTSVTTRRVVLAWNAVPCATYYRVTVKQDASGASGTVVYANNNILTNQTKTTRLTRGKDYYWRVRACGGSLCGPPSGWWKFSISP